MHSDVEALLYDTDLNSSFLRFRHQRLRLERAVPHKTRHHAQFSMASQILQQQHSAPSSSDGPDGSTVHDSLLYALRQRALTDAAQLQDIRTLITNTMVTKTKNTDRWNWSAIAALLSPAGAHGAGDGLLWHVPTLHYVLHSRKDNL
ncbi:MAG: hypothetical protein MHM6MM_009653, partial [Cercozoa sp. M6MM]